MVVNGLWLLPRTDYFDTGSLITEMAFSHVQRVTKHEELFKGEGYGGCRRAGRSIRLRYQELCRPGR